MANVINTDFIRLVKFSIYNWRKVHLYFNYSFTIQDDQPKWGSYQLTIMIYKNMLPG